MQSRWSTPKPGLSSAVANATVHRYCCGDRSSPASLSSRAGHQEFAECALLVIYMVGGAGEPCGAAEPLQTTFCGISRRRGPRQPTSGCNMSTVSESMQKDCGVPPIHRCDHHPALVIFAVFHTAVAAFVISDYARNNGM